MTSFLRHGLRNVNAIHNIPLVLQNYQPQSESEELNKSKLTVSLVFMGTLLNFAETQGDTYALTSAAADLVVQQQVFKGRLWPLKQLHQTKGVSQSQQL